MSVKKPNAQKSMFSGNKTAKNVLDELDDETQEVTPVAAKPVKKKPIEEVKVISETKVTESKVIPEVKSESSVEVKKEKKAPKKQEDTGINMSVPRVAGVINDQFNKNVNDLINKLKLLSKDVKDGKKPQATFNESEKNILDRAKALFFEKKRAEYEKKYVKHLKDNKPEQYEKYTAEKKAARKTSGVKAGEFDNKAFNLAFDSKFYRGYKEELPAKLPQVGKQKGDGKEREYNDFDRLAYICAGTKTRLITDAKLVTTAFTEHFVKQLFVSGIAGSFKNKSKTIGVEEIINGDHLFLHSFVLSSKAYPQSQIDKKNEKEERRLRGEAARLENEKKTREQINNERKKQKEENKFRQQLIKEGKLKRPERKKHEVTNESKFNTYITKVYRKTRDDVLSRKIDLSLSIEQLEELKKKTVQHNARSFVANLEVELLTRISNACADVLGQHDQRTIGVDLIRQVLRTLVALHNVDVNSTFEAIDESIKLYKGFTEARLGKLRAARVAKAKTKVKST